MSTEESRFTDAFYAVLKRNPDKPPSPTAINRELGKEDTFRTPLNTLNGRMSQLRRRLLTENGFVQDPKSPFGYEGQANFGRWRKP